MKHFRALACALLLLFSTRSLAAQDRPPRNTGDIKFWAVKDMPYDSSEPQLLGASVANPAEYPATMYSASRRGRCTSTVIGPRVLLTAAHCVGNGASALLQISGVPYTSTCTHAPEYQVDETADWALCLINGSVPRLPYENISTKPTLVAVGNELLLSGFGCTTPDGRDDGTYRIGRAPVTEIPSRQSNDIVTRGSVALCYGDSGGPAFSFLDQLRLRRVQVSVNSRGNIRDTSHLSSLSTEAAVHFLTTWSTTKRVGICGLTTGVAGCR